MMELLKEYAAIIAPFMILYTVAVAAIAYRAGKAREHMNTAGRIIAAKAEAFERGRQSVQTFDMDALGQQSATPCDFWIFGGERVAVGDKEGFAAAMERILHSADPEFQAVDKDETPISKQL